MKLNVLDEDMQELSLVLQQMVYDHISNNDVKIQEFKAPKALMKEVKLAHQYLEKLKASKKSQRELIHEQITEIKSQKQYVMRCIEVLSSDGNQLSLEAKKKTRLCNLG